MKKLLKKIFKKKDDFSIIICDEYGTKSFGQSKFGWSNVTFRVIAVEKENYEDDMGNH